MFVNFGKGKCPLCGDKAIEVGDAYHCGKCEVSFDDFMIASQGELAEYTDKYWN